MDELKEAQQAQQAAAQALNNRDDELTPVNASLAELQNDLAALQARQKDQDAELRLAHAAAKWRELAAEHQRLSARLKDARDVDAQRRRCVAQRDAIRVTAPALAAIKNIERAGDLAGERLRAAATRIEYRLEPDAAVRLEDRPLSGAGSERLTEKTQLQIKGIGQFTVIPGGEDLDGLRRTVDDEERRLTQALAEVDADSVAGAEAALREKNTLDSQASLHGATFKGLAADGLPAVEDRLSDVAAQRDSLRQKWGDTLDGEFAIDKLEQAVQTRHSQITAVQSDVSDQEKTVQALREALAGLRADQASAQRLVRSRGDDLEQARGEISDDRLREALHEKQQALDADSERLDQARQGLAAENPQAVEIKVERSTRVFDDIKQDIDTLDRDTRDLKVELSALGQQGLAEEAASIEAEHALAKGQLESAQRSARALDLLQRTLDSALRRAKQAVAQPLLSRLAPYLHQLIPDAAPLIDENLLLTGIERAGTIEAFDTLSIGTREQLAILIRLAYADLLSEAGVPVTVILDDALVNSDDERRERMKIILYQAAQRYQILVLTCHEKEYRNTGGKFIRLEEVAGGA